jgi:glycosyltransferase involved in cell wall biosynthesis
MPQTPLLSIVTPSYNMASYIEEAIQSVLSQDYPRVEYIVMDGGSTDGTLEILERYKGRLRCTSTPDKGAADAINRGFRMSSGSICAWLSADDTYLPGALSAAVATLQAQPSAGVLYGDGYWVDSAGRVFRPCPTCPSAIEALSRECLICQPACFMWRSVLEQVGMLDERLRCAFDYDLWIRLSRRTRFAYLPYYLANVRIHSGSKTLAQRRRVLEECMGVQKRHFGYVPFQSVYGYCSYLFHRTDPFCLPPRRSVAGYAFSLPVGLWQNRARVLRYGREWVSVMSLGGLVRALHDTWPGPKSENSSR